MSAVSCMSSVGVCLCVYAACGAVFQQSSFTWIQGMSNCLLTGLRNDVTESALNIMNGRITQC